MEKLRIKEFDTVQFTKMVRKIKLFSSMRMDLLEKILAWVGLHGYKKGEKICRQGDPGDSFYVVAEGKLGVSVKNGLFSFSKKVAELGPGGCFGEMALLSRAPRTATVACEEPSKLFVLLADHFDAAMAQNPAFAEEIRKLSSDRKFELDHK